MGTVDIYLHVVVDMNAPWVHGSLPPATGNTPFSTPAIAFMKNDFPVLVAPQMVTRFSGFSGSRLTASNASSESETCSGHPPAVVSPVAMVVPLVISSRRTDILHRRMRLTELGHLVTQRKALSDIYGLEVRYVANAKIIDG